MRLPHPGRSARVLGATVAVILVAELGVRSLGPYLPAPSLYADASTAVKAAQLERVGESERCGTIVLAGTSMARDDLVPSAMTTGLDDGVVVYNAALDAGSPSLQAHWLPDHVLPATDPDLVVLGLSSFDLNDRARISQSALDSFLAAPLSRDDLFGRLQEPLVRRSGLFRHRGDLRDPAAVWSALGRARRGESDPRPEASGIPGVLDADGAGLSRRDLRYTPSPGGSPLLRDELLNDFTLGGDETASLRALLDDLRGAGTEVAIAVLPVTTEYVSTHPDGSADHDRFLGLVDDVAAEAGVPVLDLHDSVPDTGFADTHHLAGQAADALSAGLPAALAEAGVALPSC